MAIDKERKYKRVTKGLFDDEPDTGEKKVRGLYTVNPEERRDFYEQHKEQQEEREQTLARNRNIMAKSYDRFRSDPFGANRSPTEKVRVSKAYYDSLHPITRAAVRTTNKLIAEVNRRNAALDSQSGLSFEEKMAEADRLERSSTTNINGNTFAVTPRTDRHGIDVSRYNNVYESPQAEAKALRRYAYQTASEPELKERLDKLKAETPAVADANYGYTHGNTGANLRIGYNGNYGTQRAVDLTPSKAESDIQTTQAYYDFRKEQRELKEFDELIGNYMQLDSEADFAEKSKYRGSLREDAEYASRYADPDYDPVGDAIRYINDKVERYGDANPGNILGGDPTKDIPWFFTGSGMAGRASTASPRELSYIHADEARRATYLYYTQGENAAAKYLNDIYPLLSERYQNRYKTTNDQLREQYVNDKSWDVLLGFIPGDKTDLKNALYNVESSIASVLLSPVSGAEGVGSLTKMLAGIGLEPGDGAFSDIQRGIRESVQEGMGQAGRLAYGTAMSIADSAFTMAVGAGMQNALGMGARTATETMNGLQRWINEGKDLGLVLMSSSAAVPAYEDAISRGLSTEQACAMGLTAAFAEFITERVSIEAFLSDPHGTLRYLGKNMLAEGSEEVASDLINTLGDAIRNGDDSELRQKTRQYIVMYGLNEKEAFSRAFAEWAVEVGLDGLGGALSGLVFGLGGVAGQMLNDARNTKAMTVENNAAPGTVANEAVRNINAAGLNALGQEVIDRYGEDSYEGKRAAKAMEAGNEGKTSERAKGELTRYIVDDMVEKGEAANADEAYNAVVSAHQMRSIYEGMRQSVSPRQTALEKVLNDPRGRSEFEARYGVKLDAKTESENVDRIIDTYKKFDNRRSEKLFARLDELTGVAAVDMNTVREYDGKKYAAAPEDNDIVLKLGDVEINADDVVFDDPAAETLIKNARTLDTNSANELVTNYKADQDAKLYSAAFRRVNLMGRQAAYGTDYRAAPDLIANDYADLVDYIGPHAAMMAYKTGMDYAKLSSYEGEKVNVYAENPTVESEYEADEEHKGQKIAPYTRTGTRQRSLDEANAAFKYIQAAAEAAGINVRIADTGTPGATAASIATVFLSPDADNIFGTFIHELGEVAHLRDPQTLKTVRDAVLNWYAEMHGIEDLEAETERYRKAYALAEGGKTYEQARNELFFDAMGGLFSTDGGVDQFGEWAKNNLSKRERNKVLNWFAELLDKIRAFFHDLVRGDAEGLNSTQKKFLQMARENEQKATEIRQAFLNAVDTTTEKAKAAPAVSESGEMRHQITAGMTDEERYLALKDRTISDVPAVTRDLLKEKNITSWEDINREVGKAKKKLVRKLAEQFGVFKSYYNDDIKLDFEYTKNSYEESYGKQEKNFTDFAKLFSVFDEVINNAVGIEIHNKNTEGYKVDPTLKNVYVLVSAFREGENIIPVKLEVKEFSDKANKLYVSISLEKIKTAEVSGQGNTENGVTQGSRSAEISIAKLLRFVKNSGDKRLAKYIPTQFADDTEETDIRHQLDVDAFDETEASPETVTKYAKKLLKQSGLVDEIRGELGEAIKAQQTVIAPTEADLAKTVRKILREASSKADADVATARLAEIARHIAEGYIDSEDLLLIDAELTDIANEIATNARIKTPLTEDQKKILGFVNGKNTITGNRTRVYISDNAKGDLEHAFDKKFGQIVKDHLGRIILTTDQNAMHVDSLYEEIREAVPRALPETTSEPDMAVKLIELVDSIYDNMAEGYNPNFEEIDLEKGVIQLDDLAADYAIDEMKKKLATALNDAIKAANSESKDVDGFIRLLAKQLGKADKQIESREKALEQLYQAKQMARDAARKEREAKAALRQTIRRTINGWQKKLENPKKNAYIPRDFIAPLIQIVEAVDNATSFRLSPAHEQEIRDKREAGATYTSLAEEYGVSINTIKNIVIGKDKPARASSLHDAIQDMKDAYAQMAEDQTVGGLSWKDSEQDRVNGWLDQIGRAENLQQLNYQQLRALRDLLNYVNKQIVGTVTEKAYGTNLDMVEYGLRAAEEIRNVDKFISNPVNRGILNFATPREVFDTVGGRAKGNLWLKVFDESLNPAQHKEQAFIQQAYDLLAPVLDFGRDPSLRKQFEKMQSTDKDDVIAVAGLVDENGEQVKLTHGAAIELYANLMREDNLRHIIVGGFKLPDMKEHVKTGAGYTKKGRVRVLGAGAETVRMIEQYRNEYDKAIAKGATDEELALIDMAYYEDIATEADRWRQVRDAIEEKLTDYDFKFLDAVTAFYDGMSKRAINEMSQELYGFDLATQRDYYPIRTDAAFRNVTDEELVRDASLEGRGNLKRRTFGRNPILIGDVFKTVQRQIKLVAQEYAYTKPISDLNRLLSARSYEYKTSVQEELVNTFGSDAMLKRIQKTVRDMIGQSGKLSDEMRNVEKIFNKVRGMEAQATLAFNIGVTLGQAASYPTAAAVVGYKALGRALLLNPDSTVEGKGHNKVVFWRAAEDLINKYTPLLRYRSAGNPATGLENATSSPAYSQRNAAMRGLFGWISAADKMTVGRLWYASEYYVNDHFKELAKNKGTSEEATGAYYKKVAEVFNRVVEETQPNYSALQRPGVLRSQNELIRTMTMFMTQRLQNFNIMYGSAMRWAKYSKDYRHGLNNVTKETRQKIADRLGMKMAELTLEDITDNLTGPEELTAKARQQIADRLGKQIEDLTAEDVRDNLGRLMGATLADVREARSSFIHGLTAVLMGQLTYRLFRELADLILRNNKDWWDEEKEGYTWEQFVKSTLHDYLGDLMGSVPIASHMYDFIDSLSNKSYDGLLTTFGIEQINDLAADIWSIIKKGGASGKQIEDLLIDASGLLGIPLRNMKKVWQGGQKWAEAAGEGKFWGKGEFNLSTNTGLLNYSMAGNMPQSEAFDMIRKEKREEYAEKYPDKSADEINKLINTAQKSAVTTAAHKRFMAAYARGDYDEMLNVQAYMRQSGFYEDIGQTCRGWIEKADEVNTDITGAQHEKLTAATSAKGKLEDALEVAATGGSYDGLEELTEDFFNDVLQKRREEYPKESSREAKKKAWESVRTKIRNELRDAYVDAYKAGDREYMREIERILRETGAFTYSKAREQTASWRESYDNEQKKKGE